MDLLDLVYVFIYFSYRPYYWLSYFDLMIKHVLLNNQLRIRLDFMVFIWLIKSMLVI